MILIRKITILILFLSSKSFVYTQNVNFELNQIDSGNYIDVSIDPLDNFYRITKNYIVKSNIDFLRNDTLRIESSSKLNSIDTKFPLKTLYFYSDKNRIQIINSRSGVLSDLKLDNLGIFQPKFVKFSSDGMIWIYDKFDNILYKVNENNQIKFNKKNPFVFKNSIMNPIDFMDIKNQVFVLDSSFGVLILNNYGEVDGVIEIKGVKNAAHVKNNIVLISDSTVIAYNLDSKTTDILNWEVPFCKNIKRLIVTHNQLFILSLNGILYKYNIKFS